MSVKKIGIVCSSKSFGGLELNGLKLAGWLMEYGWEVFLLVHEGGPMHLHAARDPLLAGMVTVCGQPGLTGKVLHQWVQGHHIPVLLTMYNKDISVLSYYKRFRNRKIRLVYQQQMKIGVNKRDWIHTFRYAMFDCWISPLEYLKQETLTRTRIPEKKIAVIPLAVETSHFSAGGGISRETARKELDLPGDSWLIGVLGRLDPKKGQDFLVRMLIHLSGQYPDLHLLLMGNATLNEGDAYVRKVKSLAAHPAIKDRIHFREHRADPLVFFRAIDVFAMPSHGETFGMVTVEAMAAGVPVIGTDRDGTRALLKQGRLGWLHGYEDESSFAQQLARIRSGEQVQEKIAHAQAEAEQVYTKEKMMPALDSLLRSFC